MENRSNFFMLKKSRKMENSMLSESWPEFHNYCKFFLYLFSVGADETDTKKILQ